jgi:CheY-like chemotaxis protein
MRALLKRYVNRAVTGMLGDLSLEIPGTRRQELRLTLNSGVFPHMIDLNWSCNASMSHSRLNILLVEDAEPDVFLVREALKNAGLDFDLKVLDDGEKAVDFIDTLDRHGEKECPELVLLDLNLPKRTGDQILEHMRHSDRCKDVPVVIVTSSDSPRDKAEASRLGATQYFRKPSRLDEFMRLGPLVRKLVGHEPGGKES